MYSIDRSDRNGSDRIGGRLPRLFVFAAITGMGGRDFPPRSAESNTPRYRGILPESRYVPVNKIYHEQAFDISFENHSILSNWPTRLYFHSFHRIRIFETLKKKRKKRLGNLSQIVKRLKRPVLINNVLK